MSKGIIPGLCLLVSIAPSQAGMRVGTPASILDGLRAENIRASSVYSLPNPAGGSFDVNIEDYYFEGRELSMSGQARNARNSRFILKGNDSGLYGWLVLKDRDVAYEYTTDASGAVRVDAVAVTDILPVCDFQGPAASGEKPVDMNVLPADSLTPHIGDYPGSDVNKLQSLPGAKKVLYLDITRVMNGDTPKDFEKAEMWKSWQAVAAGFSMYAVNVTTDPEVYRAAGVVNSGIARFFSADDRANCAMNAFGTTTYCNVYTGRGAESEKGYGVGRTTLHELGHLVGLAHDGGNPGGEYFNGLADFKWCPIMGNYYVAGSGGSDVLYQWSKGEYTGASNKQDDFAVIGKYLEYRADDIPGTAPLKMEGTKVSGLTNRGQIGRNTDEDAFAFRITGAGGRAKLKVSRIEYIGGAMLDVEARILDAGGKEVAKNNKIKARSAEFDMPLAVGDYTLVVKGGAEGTPANGFSNYSSLGFYAIEGEITAGTTGVAVPGPAAAAEAVRVSSVTADGLVELAFPENARVEKVALFSTSGAAVYQSRGRVNIINVGGLPVGLYVLCVALEGKTVSKRIVKR